MVENERMQNLAKYLNERFDLDGERVYNLSKHNLEDLKQTLQNIIREKYPRRYKRLLGVLSKAMPDDIFWQLVRLFKNRKVVQAAVLVDGIQGPRLNDLIKIKTSDIDFNNSVIRIYNSKCSRWYENPMQCEIKEFLLNWTIKYREEIEACGDYVFFDLARKSHIHENNLRMAVYKSLKKMGINKSYSESYDGRQLQLYSFHSLRGHAAMRVYELSGNDVRAVQVLLDHQPNSANTTMLYIGRFNKLPKIMSQSIGLDSALAKSEPI